MREKTFALCCVMALLMAIPALAQEHDEQEYIVRRIEPRTITSLYLNTDSTRLVDFRRYVEAHPARGIVRAHPGGGIVRAQNSLFDTRVPNSIDVYIPVASQPRMTLVRPNPPREEKRVEVIRMVEVAPQINREAEQANDDGWGRIRMASPELGSWAQAPSRSDAESVSDEPSPDLVVFSNEGQAESQ